MLLSLILECEIQFYNKDIQSHERLLPLSPLSSSFFPIIVGEIWMRIIEFAIVIWEQLFYCLVEKELMFTDRTSVGSSRLDIPIPLKI